MEVVGFIGASGTGKSHHALVVAYDHEIQTIIDDGLLIDHNRIVAGRSAKDETNRLKAVRRAVFNNPDDAAAMKAALAKAAPGKLAHPGDFAAHDPPYLRVPQSSRAVTVHPHRRRLKLIRDRKGSKYPH